MKKIEFLDLGMQPITNNFLQEKNPINEFFYELKVMYDEKTSLVSLKNFVKPQSMFNETYAHRASASATMREANRNLAEEIVKKYNPSSILEIGSNDGVFLKNFKITKKVGVEPCANLAEITSQMGINTFSNFWDSKLSNKILNQYGKFDLIYSSNTISHIHDLKDTFAAIENIIADNGIFILEDPSLLEVFKNLSYDQFYDEHAYVFSIFALNNLFKNTDLEIFDIENLDTHGGSNRIYIKKKGHSTKVSTNVNKALTGEINFGIDKIETYNAFANKVYDSRIKLIEIFNNIKKKNQKIIGYGATYKSTTILNFCGLNHNFIEYFTDTTETKQGKFTPGTHIPIIKPGKAIDEDINYAFLGAWNFKKEIFNKEVNFLNRGGKFITHVPYPKII